MISEHHALARNVAPSFDAKLKALIAETSTDDWDGEGGRAISVEQWARVHDLVTLVRARLLSAPEPHPSAGGDGSRHLRWIGADRLFDVEFVTDGRVQWARRVGEDVTSGSTASPAELLERLAEVFP